jgi:hypothetical protein
MAIRRMWTTGFSLAVQAPTKSYQLATHGSDFNGLNLQECFNLKVWCQLFIFV